MTEGRSLPSSPEAEEHVLACCLLDEGVTLKRARTAGIAADSFMDQRISRIFSRTCEMADAELPTTADALMLDGKSVSDHLWFMQVTDVSRVPTTAFAGPMIERVVELAAKRRIIREASALVEHAYNGTDLKELTAQAEALIPAKPKPKVDPESRRVSITAKPTEPLTRLFLAQKPIATPGNLVTLISRAKTGKTAEIGAIVAAIIAAHYDRHHQDTLGFTAPHTKEAVVQIDTEQSFFDAYTCHQRAFARAGQVEDVPWLLHYALVGYGVEQLKSSLVAIMAKAKSDHGSVFILILDGVADFVLSVNDEAECNAFISWLRALAVQYDCPIVCVIHSNEAAKAGDDGRGHLGKQLTRKAESNLLLKKVGEITTVTSEKQRKAPITEEDGVAFKWSEAEQRHVSCGSIPNQKDEAKRDRVSELAQSVFDHLGRPRGRYVEIVKAIETVRNVGGSRAEDRFTEMKKLGVIVKDLMGFWSIPK